MSSTGTRGDRWIAAGAIVALLGVAAGAFGAHGLRDRIGPESLAVFEVAVRYQMYHAFALVAVGILARGSDPRRRARLRVAGWCFLAGIVLFSGSLYTLALTGLKALGAVTPLGGAAFLLGWTAIAVNFLLSGKDATAE
jgi:uncharacterized membrane protein YgdD (TMEM256/DUF423 family)